MEIWIPASRDVQVFFNKSLLRGKVDSSKLKLYSGTFLETFSLRSVFSGTG